MTTRAGILGVGTGGMLLVALFYPLYLKLPGQYVRGWPPGSVLISAGAVATALVLTVLGGWWAARWSNAVSGIQCVGLGALAGGVAAFLAFCGLGAAAAGTLSSSVVLQSEPALVQNTVAGKAVFLETVSRNVIWTQLMFWGMMSAGILLGAVGGRLNTPRSISSPSPYNTAHPQMALNVSITAVPATVLTVIVAATLFLRLSDVLQKMAAAHGIPPASALLNIQWPLTTAVLLYLAAHAALTLVTPHEARQARHRCGMDEVKMAAYVGIAAPFALGAGVLLVHAPLMLRPAVGGSWLISLGMSARLIWVLRTLILPKRAQLPAPPDMRQAIFFGSIANSRRHHLLLLCAGCGLMMVFPMTAAVVSVALNLWLIPIQRLVLNSPEPATKLVQQVYQAQAAANLGSSVGAGAILAGLYLGYAALGRWFQRLGQSAVRHQS